MPLQRTTSIVALIAATFVFVDSASSQPRAPDTAPAASAAEHKGMHGMSANEREQHRREMHDNMHGDKAGNGDHDRKGMMGQHHEQAMAHRGARHAGHARHDNTAAAHEGCGMGNPH